MNTKNFNNRIGLCIGLIGLFCGAGQLQAADYCNGGTSLRSQGEGAPPFVILAEKPAVDMVSLAAAASAQYNFIICPTTEEFNPKAPEYGSLGIQFTPTVSTKLPTSKLTAESVVTTNCNNGVITVGAGCKATVTVSAPADAFSSEPQVYTLKLTSTLSNLDPQYDQMQVTLRRPSGDVSVALTQLTSNPYSPQQGALLSDDLNNDPPTAHWYLLLNNNTGFAIKDLAITFPGDPTDKSQPYVEERPGATPPYWGCNGGLNVQPAGGWQCTYSLNVRAINGTAKAFNDPAVNNLGKITATITYKIGNSNDTVTKVVEIPIRVLAMNRWNSLGNAVPEPKVITDIEVYQNRLFVLSGGSLYMYQQGSDLKGAWVDVTTKLKSENKLDAVTSVAVSPYATDTSAPPTLYVGTQAGSDSQSQPGVYRFDPAGGFSTTSTWNNVGNLQKSVQSLAVYENYGAIDGVSIVAGTNTGLYTDTRAGSDVWVASSPAGVTSFQSVTALAGAGQFNTFLASALSQVPLTNYGTWTNSTIQFKTVSRTGYLNEGVMPALLDWQFAGNYSVNQSNTVDRLTIVGPVDTTKYALLYPNKGDANTTPILFATDGSTVFCEYADKLRTEVWGNKSVDSCGKKLVVGTLINSLANFKTKLNGNYLTTYVGTSAGVYAWQPPDGIAAPVLSSTADVWKIVGAFPGSTPRIKVLYSQMAATTVRSPPTTGSASAPYAVPAVLADDFIRPLLYAADDQGNVWVYVGTTP